MMEILQSQLQPLEQLIRKHNNDIIELEKKFDSSVQNVRKETLWRIQDAEELIKSRVSDGKLDSVQANLEQGFKISIEKLESDQMQKMEKIFGKLHQKDSEIESHSEN
jgi:hypothetical protein